MSTAFIYGKSGGGAADTPFASQSLATGSSSFETHQALTHEAPTMFIITVGPNSDYYPDDFLVNGVSLRTRRWDGNYKYYGTAFCATALILSVKRADGTYNLCKLDGTVVVSAATELYIQNYQQGLFLTAVTIRE